MSCARGERRCLLLLAALAAAWSLAVAPARAAATDPIAHDPTVLRQGAYYYAIITGDIATRTYLPIKRSTDLVRWEEQGVVFETPPAWVPAELGVTPGDFWAPDLSYFNGRYHLYYAASQFATNNSVIGLATNATLDPADPAYHWVDEGMVLRSTPGVDEFNAIDPELVTDASGHHWLAFGSFWSGIKLRRLDDATGKPSTTDTQLHSLASRAAPGAVEGPSIVRHGRFYYLFVSFDFCCRGADSDYRTMVGRSRSVTGPYVDADGVPMLQGGGTELVRGYDEFAGPGGGDVFRDGGVTYFAHHYYDAGDAGAPKLSIRRVHWRSGWPTLSDPLSGSRGVGHGGAWFKLVERHSGKVVENAGCGLEGANIQLASDVASPCRQWRLDPRGAGSVSIGNRFSNKVAEAAGCADADAANVAQWGWLANDCQRWSLAATSDGWTRILSRLPGARAMEAAGCGAADGTNVQLGDAVAGRCQEFRLEPVGEVLLAAPDGRQVLAARCGAARGEAVRFRAADPSRCASWTFAPAGDATYTVAVAGRRAVLGLADCEDSGSRLVLTRPRSGCARWRIEPRADGSFGVVEARTSRTVVLRILRP